MFSISLEHAMLCELTRLYYRRCMLHYTHTSNLIMKLKLTKKHASTKKGKGVLVLDDGIH